MNGWSSARRPNLRLYTRLDGLLSCPFRHSSFDVRKAVQLIPDYGTPHYTCICHLFGDFDRVLVSSLLVSPVALFLTCILANYTQLATESYSHPYINFDSPSRNSIQ
jgi:hypothetical protein